MLLEISHITKRYRRGDAWFSAVENASLRLQAGESASLTGRSGSGKTTLLNMAVGLLSPDSGEILLDGVKLFSLEDRERTALRNAKIGYVPQGRSLLGNLTALDNARLPFHLQPRTGDSLQRSRELFAELGIAHLENSYPAELSGGETRRVALARALINSPELIIADEPTSDLDIETARDILALFSRLQEQGASVLLATHDVQAGLYGDRILSMSSGRLAEDPAGSALACKR
jgi:putative ABC transport system ATP-binding protein